MNQNGTMTFTEMEAIARRKAEGQARILSAIAPVLVEIYSDLASDKPIRAAVGPAD